MDVGDPIAQGVDIDGNRWTYVVESLLNLFNEQCKLGGESDILSKETVNITGREDEKR